MLSRYQYQKSVPAQNKTFQKKVFSYHALLVGSKVLSSKVPGNMRKTPLGIPIYLEDNEHTDVVNRDA